MSLDVSLTRPCCGALVFDANITHNLIGMAKAAGVYEACWQPQEIGATKAEHLIGRLRDGLAWLRAHPDEARRHNPLNGWGDYAGLVAWIEKYLEACEANPEAEVSVSR